MEPRGIRNNNPGNIEDGPFARSIPGYLGSDGRFARFESPDNGIEAINRLLGIYERKHGLNTIGGIVNRWAPSHENNVSAYAASLSKATGLPVDAPIPPEKRSELVAGIIQHENGKNPYGVRPSPARSPANALPVGFELLPDAEPTQQAKSASGLPDGFELIDDEQPADPRTMGVAPRAVQEQGLKEGMRLAEGLRGGSPSMAGSFGRGVARGATFGMLDEGQGLAAAAPGILGRQEQQRQASDRAAGLPTIPDPITLALGAARRLFGGGQPEYDQAVNAARAQQDADRAVNPWSSIAGEVGGGVAVPMGAVRTVGQGIRTGAAAAGLYGFGEGEGGADSATKAAGGAIVGGALGGALGRLVGGGGPGAPNAVAAAGDRINAALPSAELTVPKFIASESMPVQRIAAAERNIPLAGDKIVKAYDATKQGLGRAADEVASNLGGTSARGAGERASDEIIQYVGPELKKVSERAYSAVDNLVAPNAGMTHSLSETQKVVADILSRRLSSGTSNTGAAVEAVREAITRPGGLTYQGIKDLRSRFGTKVSDDLTQDVISSEFKRLYGALSDDLKSAVSAAGGPKALSAFERANGIHKLAMQRREQLEKIVGASGDNTGETVFSRIEAMASGTSRGDIATLATARKALGPDAWNELAGSVVQRLGRDAEGAFTADRFVTSWGKLSKEGKAMLFGGNANMASALDDIATVASRMKELNKFANPSGTAQNVMGSSALMGGGFAAGIDPITTATALVGNRAIASILASPATASSMARWSRTYEALVRRPTTMTLSAFNQASKNFASTLADKVGVTVAPQDFLRAMQGAVPIRAESEQQ